MQKLVAVPTVSAVRDPVAAPTVSAVRSPVTHRARRMLRAACRVRTNRQDTEPTHTWNLEKLPVLQDIRNPTEPSPVGTHRGIQNRLGLAAQVPTPQTQAGSVARRHPLYKKSQAVAENNEPGTYQKKQSQSISGNDRLRHRGSFGRLYDRTLAQFLHREIFFAACAIDSWA